MLLTIVVFIIILSVLVLVHEAGHFFVAKLLKIKVEEFGFGLPPRAFGIKYGETIYSINWLPIGGFVKLYGEDEAGSGSVSIKPQNLPEKDLKRAYFSRPKWQKTAVIIAGVIMNFLLAVVILSYLYSAVGVPVPNNKVVVVEVLKNSPAEKVGIVAGDTIEKVKGTSITSTSQLIKLVDHLAGTQIPILIKTQNGKEIVLNITPRKNYPKNQGPMGVAISPGTDIKRYPWYEAPFVGTKEALNETWLIVNGLVMLTTQILTRGAVPQDVAGPVGIAQLTGTVVSIGFNAVLSFVALLSLNLAIVNILPFPALDGGRLLFIAIEAVTRRKVDPVLESYIHTVGMAILLALIALITVHDLLRIFSGQPIIPK